MNRLLLPLISLLPFVLTAEEKKMEFTDFEDLVAQSTDYMRAQNEKNNRLFGIGDYARYEYDLFRSVIWWSDEKEPKVRAKVTVVGSTSTKSDTWMWAWANPHFGDIEIGLIEKVKEFGERESIQKLVEKKWDADEIDGWEMTSISGRLLESQGAYKSPGTNGSLFLLYDGLEFIPEEEKEQYRPLKKDGAEPDAGGNG